MSVILGEMLNVREALDEGVLMANLAALVRGVLLCPVFSQSWIQVLKLCGRTP